VDILVELLGDAAKAIAPEVVRVGVPYLAKAATAMFNGDEAAAAKHIRIGAQKVAAKLAIRVKR
jgi:hypothetical protein